MLWWQWVLVGVAILFGVPLIVALIGSRLPKGHVAIVRARLAATPPPAVWATLADFASWPSWNPQIRAMDRAPDREGRAVWVMVDRNGKMPTEIAESIAPEGGRAGKLVTRIADPSLPYGGTWTWDVAPDADSVTATNVTITEDGVIHNALFRFLARFAFGYTGTADAYLRALGAKHGESVTPEVVRAR